MSTNREPSNQSFEVDREAAVCSANRRFFLTSRRTGLVRQSYRVLLFWNPMIVAVDQLMSAIPLKADMDQSGRDVCFVPIADIR
jgi:hypothetical protein